jgi:acid phosphatase (class A)
MQKYIFILLLLGLTASGITQAQKSKPRELTPARGHYKSLQAFSKKPASAGLAIDQEKFPFDSAAAKRRLSLKPYFLEGMALEAFTLPDPPANSSEQTRAEINYLLALQQQRTSLDVETSLFMANVYYNPRVKPEDSTYHQYRKNLFFIGRSIGSWFNPTDLPLTAELMAHVWQDASYFIWSAKYKYLRIRPYKIDTDLKNLEETNWAAYPSGHAANSYVNAFIYQELAPEFADVFMKDAYDMAHSREIIGVHYPSDSEASRILARQLVNKLFQNEKFLKAFELVKQEWVARARENFRKPELTEEDLKKQKACATKGSGECAKKCE